MHEPSNTRPLHPIAKQALEALVVAEGELRMPRRAGLEIASAVASSFEGEELEWAVRSLLLTASRLDDRGDHEAASALVGVATGGARELWKAASTRSNERRRLNAAKQDRALGNGPLTAPRFAAPPPPDSVCVASLFSCARRA